MGHMENTCDLILTHGGKDPQILVDCLKNGGPEPQVAMDEELARRMTDSGTDSSGNASGGRGTPTTLPADFLRLPGFVPPPSETNRTAATGNASNGQPMDDEALARMLQDELFSEELARNPNFAHLAGQRRSQPRVSASNARIPAGPAGAPLQNPFEGVDVMKKLSSMGDGARRSLQLFANNFENRMKGINKNNTQNGGGLQEARGAASERRGLLDDDDYYGEDMIEFETRKSR